MERTPEEIQAFLASKNINGYKALVSDVLANYANFSFEARGDMPSLRKALQSINDRKIAITPEIYERLEGLQGEEIIPLIGLVEEIIDTVGGAKKDAMGRVIKYRYSLEEVAGKVRRPAGGGWISELGISEHSYRQHTRGFFDRARHHRNISAIVDLLKVVKLNDV